MKPSDPKHHIGLKLRLLLYSSMSVLFTRSRSQPGLGGRKGRRVRRVGSSNSFGAHLLAGNTLSRSMVLWMPPNTLVGLMCDIARQVSQMARQRAHSGPSSSLSGTSVSSLSRRWLHATAHEKRAKQQSVGQTVFAGKLVRFQVGAAHVHLQAWSGSQPIYA